MPRYSYECLDMECGVEFEATRPVDRRDDPARCPVCESRRDARRVFAPTTNFLIPAHFKDVSSASWMLPDDPKAERGERNARIASPPERKSFKPKLLEAIKHL